MKNIFFSFLMLFFLAGCATGNHGEFAEEIYSPQYAEHFELRKVSPDGESTVLVSKAPWQSADSLSRSILLLRKNGEEIPTSFNGQILEKIPERIVCMSSGHIAMLDALGAADRIKGVSGLGFISNKTVLNSKDVKDVGYDGNIDYEALMAARPDLVLLYGVGGPTEMEGKLRELRIPYIYIAEHVEEDPLGKAEWLVPLGEILGMRSQAEAKFAEIPVVYNALKEKVASVESKPKVMLNTPYRDSWVIPSMQSYVARLVADAGGEMVYQKNNGNYSKPIDMEEAFYYTDNADMWINVGQFADLVSLTQAFPKYADTKPVRNGQVWNTVLRVTPGGGNDYWESGVVNPHLVLQDLIKIFHPQLLEDVDFTYYKRLE